MNKDRLFVIMCDIPWNWTADYVRKTAMYLAGQGKVFCFFWKDVMSLKEYFMNRKNVSLVSWVAKDIMLYQAVNFVPFKRFKLVVKINRLINIMVFQGLIFLNSGFKAKLKVLWIFHPYFGQVLKYFSGYKIVYDSLDYFMGAVVGKQKEELEMSEKLILKQADLVVANSHFLQGRLLPTRSDAQLVPQGFDVAAFERMKNGKQDRRFKHPVIGFVGGINFRLDYDLLYQLAKRQVNWQIVLWGPVQDMELYPETAVKWKKLLSLKNVIWGVCERNKLGGIIKQFDVAIIPYLMDQPFNKFCYPMKVFEYFYFGRPVVSAAIDEFRYPPFKNKLVEVAGSWSEWEEKISKSLRTRLSADKIAKQKKLAVENSWENKLSMIFNLMFNSR